ncbi:MAG: T9SS type A sorting domain-containing protein, partial [Bacteroidia bacterium]|nr:T9SS type A sorting domain-containing protein [Bacteroidia bacterium]
QFFLSVFPNPVIDELNISSDEEFDKIELYDLIGNKVLSEKIHETKNYKLKIDKFEAGCYFLSVSSDKKIVTQKIIISANK